jgi:hypothetical protein
MNGKLSWFNTDITLHPTAKVQAGIEGGFDRRSMHGTAQYKADKRCLLFKK